MKGRDAPGDGLGLARAGAGDDWKTGKLEPRWNAVLTELMALRHASDYASVFVLPAENVAQRIEQARELVALARELVTAAAA